MQMRIRDMFDECEGERDAIAVIWMDLDRFKEINDSLGHIVGDQLLTAVAEKIGDALGAEAQYPASAAMSSCYCAARPVVRVWRTSPRIYWPISGSPSTLPIITSSFLPPWASTL